MQINWSALSKITREVTPKFLTTLPFVIRTETNPKHFTTNFSYHVRSGVWGGGAEPRGPYLHHRISMEISTSLCGVCKTNREKIHPCVMRCACKQQSALEIMGNGISNNCSRTHTFQHIVQSLSGTGIDNSLSLNIHRQRRTQ